MTIEELIELAAGLEHVRVQRPGPGDDAPELAWGDVFCFYAPTELPPTVQPFATIVTKDYPGDERSRLGRAGAYRVNLAVGRDDFRTLIGRATRAEPGRDEPDPATPDTLIAHPVYGSLGWVAVVDPADRTSDLVRRLFAQAYELARSRYERRRS